MHTHSYTGETARSLWQQPLRRGAPSTTGVPQDQVVPVPAVLAVALRSAAAAWAAAVLVPVQVFTTVRSRVKGVITQIYIQDAQFIEYGHVLFRVRLA